MKKLIILSLIAISFSGCNFNSPKEENTSDKKEVVTTEDPSSLLDLGCYSYNANNNIQNLEITNLNDAVEGKLTYLLDGKDSNTGTFNGTLTDDKLIGTYTFMSEGVESKREVAFLIKDNQLIEGYGELNDDGTAFVDKGNISYTSKMPLEKVDCAKRIAECLYVNGKVYSNLQQTCLELTALNIKLNPLKNGGMIKGSPAYLMFDENKSKVELFLPNANESMVLSKTNEGNWSYRDYKLIAWKGYVVQYKGSPVFGGE